MAARPLVTVYNAATGAADGSVALPSVFTGQIRRDVVQAVHDNIAQNRRQAFAVSKAAGHQHSAESWGTGRAVARVPRVSGSGTHRSGQAAFANFCRSGRMFAPSKTWRKWHRKVSVNQRRFAITSALAATAVPALVTARGHRINFVAEIPLVVSNLEAVAKTSDAVKVLKRLGAYADVQRAIRSRKLRAGQGKMRNRRYVERRGPLVVSNGSASVEHAFRNIAGVQVAHVDRLNLLQLAPGGHLGRFVIWTRDAFTRLEDLYGSQSAVAKLKSGYKLPRPAMANADLARIINSAEIQAVVKPAKANSTAVAPKTNPLRNRKEYARLNPYVEIVRKHEAEASARRAAKKAAATKQKRTAAQQAERRSLRQGSKKFFNAMVSEEWKF